MKTPQFEYHAARTVDEALALLAEHGDEAKVIAGGQSLVPLLAMRLARPSQLIDVNDVAGLSGISEGAGYVAFGATTREREAEKSAVVTQRIPVMAEALPFIGHVSIRNRGTIGGSIAHADAAAELPAVATLTEASMVVRSAKGGERVLAAADFFDGHFTTTMHDDELLVEVRIPVTTNGSGWAYHEISRRHGDFALVGAAAMVDLDGSGKIAAARLVLTGMADRAHRPGAAEAALVGSEPSADSFTAAAAAAVADLEPASDVHGSAEVRRHLATVAVRRALASAADRAEGAA
jgi:carbon-monoxide dehydrogenase medium subunit